MRYLKIRNFLFWVVFCTCICYLITRSNLVALAMILGLIILVFFEVKDGYLK